MFWKTTCIAAALSLAHAPADEVREKIDRADRAGQEFRKMIDGVVTATHWAPDDSRLIFRIGTGDGGKYSQWLADTVESGPAFDHAALAAALGKATDRDIREDALPLDAITPAPGGDPTISFTACDRLWSWHPQSGLTEITRPEPEAEPERPRHRQRNRNNGNHRDARSPDGRWTAMIENQNLILRPKDGTADVPLTTDGTADHPYAGPFHWAPDSQALVAWRARSVEERRVHIVQAAPDDQLQPRLHDFRYAKPGDEIAQPMPRLFATGGEDAPRELALDESLFDNPWSNQRTWWSADGASFEFLHNRRGHQLLRLVRLDARTGEARAVIEETSPTFIDYSQKTWLHRLDGGREILWMTERDGHNHLILVDAATGAVKQRVTQGEWNVRRVIDVDEDARSLFIETIGMDRENPCHSHFARVAIDGGALTRLTTSPGHHQIEVSPGGRWLVATWSRPDHPPVVEVRNAVTGAHAAELSRADAARALAGGWQPPERFVAKGRDGETDIHGLIYRPIGFDPARKYPVVENIYAGPHDFFVPQKFSAWDGNMRMAHHGFVVVKIDGMGTNWRGRKFHDVAWKNLGDSGFPDRIAWIRAAAATRPWMDLGRVGIYGGSAGGQSTVAGMLHHGDFYHVGVADCGCHDNRMDKIWWNEAWMGWPIDDSYARNSNATHAAKLQGRLLLIVGEMDKNVDPASTDQLAAALQKAGKRFDYVKIFNAGHGAAESPYGNLIRTDFLLRHLQP